jgi:branched-chain amino acid transport system substrate-binding protein
MKPDAIVLNVPKGIMVPMLAAAEQQGLAKKIHFGSSTPAYNSEVPRPSARLGPTDIHLEFMPVESAGPDNLNWKATMDAYAGKTDPRDSFAQAGYLAARIATEALLKMDPKRSTAPASARRCAVKGFTAHPVQAVHVGDGARHNANSSGPIAQVSGNGFKLVSSGCLTAADPELADLREQEEARAVSH